MPFTAVVMSGGGAKGSFQVGALDHLIRQMKVDPEVVAGVSTGNLNAAMLAQGRGHAGLVAQLDRLTEIWTAIKKNGDVYRERMGMKIGRLFGLLGGKVGDVTGGVGAAAGALLFGADSVYTNEPLWKMIQAHVQPERLRSSGRKLRVGVVDLVSGELCVVKETSSTRSSATTCSSRARSTRSRASIRGGGGGAGGPRHDRWTRS